MPFPVPIAGIAEGDNAAETPSFSEQTAALHDVSPDDYLAVGLAWLVQASGEAVLDAPPGDRRAWREIVARRIAELDLGLQARVFRAPRQAGSSGPDMLSTLVADRTPEAITDLILARPAAVVGEPSALLERILRRTLTDERRLVEVESLLRQRLMQRGMSQDSFRNVVGLLLDQIRTDMAMRVGGRVDWLGDFEHLPPTAGGTVDDWPDLLRTISAESVSQARARVLLNMLPYEHGAAQYVDLVACLETSLTERAAAKDPQVLDIVRALAAEAERRDAVRAPIARGGLQRAATAEVAQLMRNALAEAGTEEWARLIPILGQMGNHCAEVLVEEIEKAQDPQTRALAVRCLADAGERGASEVRRLLAHGTFDRSMLTAAALIDGRHDRFLTLLSAGFEHRQSMVRARLAEWLARVPGLASEQLLIRALYDEDPSVQTRAAESLGEMRAAGAVHALTLAATKGTLHGRGFEVRKAAIQALGKIGNPDAVPALNELMHKRSLWFRDRAEELAVLAAGALALIPAPEAEQAVKRSSRRMQEIARQAREHAATAARDREEARRE
jgi:HEAT repeat protein